MDLSTRYLNLNLAHPLMPGASTLANNMDTVRRLEDAGAAAICMPSLFEEQIERDRLGILEREESTANSAAEAVTYFPDHSEFNLGPESYLEQIRKIRAAVSIPVIASLNGVSSSGWIDHAKLMQDAGAHAIELNIFFVAADPEDTAGKLEDEIVAIVGNIKKAITIPVALKLTPTFTALANLARRVEEAGVDGFVLFNRAYQPDIDIDKLEMILPRAAATAAELLVRVRWLSILTVQSKCSFAVSGGVQTVPDVVKSLMAGAHAVQTVSSLMQNGVGHLKTLRDGLSRWLEEHEYSSLDQLRGSMDLRRSPDPSAFLRASYVKALSRSAMDMQAYA
ncbi:MAG: dihydroorotate dehydrogenase-like protein [Alphaproteobacteria bacterium]